MRQVVMCLGIVATAIVASGCGVQPPLMRDSTRTDGGTGTDSDSTGGTDGEKQGMLLPPEAQVPSTTMWNTVPVRGRGPADGLVLMESETAGTMTAIVSSDGRFCHDVPLDKGTLNTITLRAQDRNGNWSETVQIQVQQSGDPPSGSAGTEAQNIAPGGKPGTNEYIEWGVANNMVDNNPTSAFVLRSPPSYLGWSGWVWIDLRTRGKVNVIRVRSEADCPLKKYALFVSNLDSPGDPPAYTGGNSSTWIKVGEVTRGMGDETIQFEARMARTVSLRFLDQDCGLFGSEKHKVSEIEVWTEGLPGDTVAQPPTCLAGN